MRLKELDEVDAVITDPPYNISELNEKNHIYGLRGHRQGLDFGEWDKGFNLVDWIPLVKIKRGGVYDNFLFIPIYHSYN